MTPDASGPDLPTAQQLLALLPADTAALLLGLGAVATDLHLHVWLVGGAVRDLLLRQQGATMALPGDFDCAVRADQRSDGDGELPTSGWPPALALAEAMACWCERQGLACDVASFSSYGTASLQLEGASTPPRIDLATTRKEHYTAPGMNPTVMLGSPVRPVALLDDLRRRDFSCNAMALSLQDPLAVVFDPFAGWQALQRKELRLLHGQSLRDDPSRLIRAARYGARFGCRLGPGDRRQARRTLQQNPWGDDVPARGSRLGMEVRRLFCPGARRQRDELRDALAHLQQWGGAALLDPALADDPTAWRRLCWFERLLSRCPDVVLADPAALLAWLVPLPEPAAVAQRLQLATRTQHLLDQARLLRTWLPNLDAQAWPASAWSEALEAGAAGPAAATAPLMAGAVALVLAAGEQTHRRPLLRWLLGWRHLRPPISATVLMAREGLKPGPALGQRLQELRHAALDDDVHGLSGRR
ncbi:MAG: CCA tRNA nucleotidyltransferase [Aphanocapsa feldmannii 288cV]|nr:MAG: CCA tRNA nucleotidyltransferase [Aphanocapsa feldmannii 288cV]